jgi:hypothetical protein
MVWKKNTRPPRFKVGDWVTFQFGVRSALAQVIEHRGALGGVEQRHLYRIRHDREDSEPDLFEIPEDEIEPASPPVDQSGDDRYSIPQSKSPGRKKWAMRPEELTALLRTRPFNPLRVHMIDGRTYDIRHPDLILVLRGRIDIGIGPDPQTGVLDRVDHCSWPQVMRVEELAGPIPTGGNGTTPDNAN